MLILPSTLPSTLRSPWPEMLPVISVAALTTLLIDLVLAMGDWPRTLVHAALSVTASMQARCLVTSLGAARMAQRGWLAARTSALRFTV